jgi:hypothetical protein
MNDTPTPQENPEQWEDFEAELEDLFGEEVDIYDPGEVVTIRATAGGVHYIPSEEATPIQELLTAANLTVSQDIRYWVDGAEVTPDHVVGPGAVVTAVGQVKGG